MAKPELDPEQFLESLKEQHRILRWEPLPPDEANRPLGGEQARNSSALAYLHQHWTLPDRFHDEDAGGGPKGRLVSVFGRLTYRVLGRYLREERELLGHMVRISETLEQRCDELTMRIAELNEEIIRRQVAEARNQALLAAWLHAEPPVQAVAPASTGTRIPAGTAPAATRSDADGSGSAASPNTTTTTTSDQTASAAVVADVNSRP